MDLIATAALATRLGVTSPSPEYEDLARLNAAVSDEIRRLTRRGLDGSPTSYTEVHTVYRPHRVIHLQQAPVQAITSVHRIARDWSTEALEAAQWWLSDPERGTLELRGFTGSRVKVVYVATGAIPASVEQAALDWVLARWALRSAGVSVAAGQTGYTTGEDSETWSPSFAGRPPVSSQIALGLHARVRGGVV